MPECVEVGELRELDVTDDGAQVPGLEDSIGLVRALKLELKWVLLMGEDICLAEHSRTGSILQLAA